MRLLRTLLVGIGCAAVIAVACAVVVGRGLLPGGIRMFVVMTGSMKPSLPAGSLIVTSQRRVYAPGDIISFTSPQQHALVTHRILSVHADWYTTKGDANTAQDFEPVHASAIIGRVLLVVPYLGYLVSFIKTPAGFVIVLLLPAIYVVISESQVIVDEVRRFRKRTS